MRSVTYRTEDLQRAKLTLGFVGENLHTRFIFDCKRDFAEYPSAAPALTVQPPEGEPYPAVITRDGDLVYWVVKDSDLINQGDGEIQLAFVQDEVVKRTYIGKTTVLRSIIPTGEIQDPLNDFLVEASAALTAIPQTIADALAAAKASGEFDGDDGVGIDRITLNSDYTLTIYLTDGSSYTTESIRGAKGDPGDPGKPGDDGISPTITVTDITGGHRLTITDKAGTRTVDVMDGEPGDPGKPGDDGVSPTVTITNITGGHRVTITDKAGSHVFDVMDGAKGDPGDPSELINDEAGAGDTDVTFSADKLTADHSSLLNALSKSSENTNIAISAHPVGDLFWYNGTLHVATTAIAVGDTIVDTGSGANCKDTTISEALIRDVQINGTSILDAQGVANIPLAIVPNSGVGTAGLIKLKDGNGLYLQQDGSLYVLKASYSQCRDGVSGEAFIRPYVQDYAVFFGLSKIAGYDLKNKSVQDGVYPEESKSAISDMLNAPETVSGTTPVITAKSGIRYICGECATLDITAPESGDIEVIFDSGSTATVLTVTPPTGVTDIKWANGFDPTALDTNTRYDLIITDGEWGLAASWVT